MFNFSYPTARTQFAGFTDPRKAATIKNYKRGKFKQLLCILPCSCDRRFNLWLNGFGVEGRAEPRERCQAKVQQNHYFNWRGRNRLFVRFFFFVHQLYSSGRDFCSFARFFFERYRRVTSAVSKCSARCKLAYRMQWRGKLEGRKGTRMTRDKGCSILSTRG